MKAVDKQREIYKTLFAQGSVGRTGRDRYTVWNRGRNPVRRFGTSMYMKIKRYCRHSRDGGLVIDLRIVRAARKNSWIKSYYLQMKRK